MSRLAGGLLSALMLAGFSSPAHADLVPQPDGTVFDEDLGIYWLGDANLAATNTFGVDGLETEGDGRMLWDQAVEFIAAMNRANYLCHDDWRLVNMNRDGDEFVRNCVREPLLCADNEYGHLFHEEGVTVFTQDDYPFFNIQDDALAGYYWSGTEYLGSYAWWFNFSLGGQNIDWKGDETALHYVWPVRDGSAPAVQTFNDVPCDFWAFSFVETLAQSGITAGCGNNNYCPEDRVTRAQMAVFLERGMNGSDYVPPPASGTAFDDVAQGDFAANFIEQLYSDGITAGCGNNNYCPDAAVSRAQMAVFLLRAKHGAGYSPPAATGVFNDVDTSYWAVHWIEQLANEGIPAGCGDNNYCPEAPVTRAQMAVFLVRTFGL